MAVPANHAVNIAIASLSSHNQMKMMPSVNGTTRTRTPNKTICRKTKAAKIAIINSLVLLRPESSALSLSSLRPGELLLSSYSKRRFDTVNVGNVRSLGVDGVSTNIR